MTTETTDRIPHQRRQAIYLHRRICGIYYPFGQYPEGPTFFVVEKDTEGYERGKSEVKHGIRASNTSPLSFTNVFVPIEKTSSAMFPDKG